MALIFYQFLVLFGSYFILNLILAVIMSSFSKHETIQEIEEQNKKKQKELQESLGNQKD